MRGGPWSISIAPGSYTYAFITEATVAPASDTMAKRTIQSPQEQATVTVDRNGAVQITSPTVQENGACDPAAVTVARARQLIPVLPAHIVAGDSWADSTVTDGCRGSIPATSHTTHTYTPLGDTTYAGVTALHIRRADTLNARGEGAEGQHRVLLTASGTGTTDLLFDVTTGRLLRSEAVQNSSITLNTSGRIAHFVQHVAEHVTLISGG